jgi:hypothetical protein
MPIHMNSPAIMSMTSTASGEPARSERPSLKRPRTPPPTAQSNPPSSDSVDPGDDSSKAGDVKSSPTDSGYHSGGSDTAAKLQRQRTSYDREAIIACLNELQKGVLPVPTPPSSEYLEGWHRDFHVPVGAWSGLRESISALETDWRSCKPRIDYNADLEILTLRMSTRLHEYVLKKSESLIEAKLQALSNDPSLPEDLRESIKEIEPAGTPKEQLGQSQRYPDLTFAHPDTCGITFVGEAAHSQPTTKESVGIMAEQYLFQSAEVKTLLYYDIKYRTPEQRRASAGFPPRSTYQVFRYECENDRGRIATNGPCVFWDEGGVVNPDDALILHVNDFFCTESEVEAADNAKIEITHAELGKILSKAQAAQDYADRPFKRKRGSEPVREHSQQPISPDRENPRAEPDTVFDPAREAPGDDSAAGEPSSKRLRRTPARATRSQVAE